MIAPANKITNVYAFCGAIAAGKSTAAEIMARQLHLKTGRRILHLPFAAPLKALCRAAGWDGVKDARGRKLLQAVGAAGRAYDGEIWVKQWSAVAVKTEDIVITDDLRYANELAAIRAVNGIVIRVDNPHVISNDPHESERDWQTFVPDYTLINDTSLADLGAKIRELLS